MIGGLPFTSDTTTNNMSGFCVGSFVNTATALVHLTAYVEVNTTFARLQMASAATTGLTAPVQGDITGDFDVLFSAEYQATA